MWRSETALWDTACLVGPVPPGWGLCSYFKRQNSLIEVKQMGRNKLKTNKNTVSPQTEGRPTREAPRLCRVAYKQHGYQEMHVPDVCGTCVITGEAFPLSGRHCIPGRRRLCCISLCELQEQIDPSTLTAPNTEETAQGSQLFFSSGSLSETFFFLYYFPCVTHVSQAISILLGSNNSPASITQVPGMVGAQRNAWLKEHASEWRIPCPRESVTQLAAPRSHW